MFCTELMASISSRSDSFKSKFIILTYYFKANVIPVVQFTYHSNLTRTNKWVKNQISLTT